MLHVAVSFELLNAESDTIEFSMPILNYVGDAYPTDQCLLNYTRDDCDNLTLKFSTNDRGERLIREWMEGVSSEYGFKTIGITSEEISHDEWEEHCEQRGLDPDELFS